MAAAVAETSQTTALSHIEILMLMPFTSNEFSLYKAN